MKNYKTLVSEIKNMMDEDTPDEYMREQRDYQRKQIMQVYQFTGEQGTSSLEKFNSARQRSSRFKLEPTEPKSPAKNMIRKNRKAAGGYQRFDLVQQI